MKTWLALAVVLLSTSASAGEFQRVFIYGNPVVDPPLEATRERLVAWNRHIDYAGWVNDNQVIFATGSGAISCLAIDTNKLIWSIPNKRPLRDWSICRAMRRLVYLADDGRLCVVDCTNGKKLFDCDSAKLAKLLRMEYAHASHVNLMPKDGRLIVNCSARSYGRNGYVLDSSYSKLLSTFAVDASPRELAVSPDGNRIAVVADKDVLCVRELAGNGDVFLRGKRILQEPESSTFSIGPPFFSHIRHDGANIIVSSLDGGCWGTGKVFVYDLATKTDVSFGARNGHVELDVAFPTRRIALTGTSASLTLTDFDGKELIHAENITKQRNTCVEFSPAGDRILVGSWDSTISVFKINE